MKERRNSVRLATVSLVRLEDDGEPLNVVLTNVSSGGIECCGSPVGMGQLHAGDTVDCHFLLPTGRISGRTRVAWVEPDRERAGLFFTHLQPRSHEPLRAYCSTPF